MGLIQLLRTTGDTVMSDDSGSWRQFVLDHLDYIAARTQPSEISAPLANQYRYDLKRFLKNYLARQRDIAWIVLLLNNLSCDFDFDKPGVYIFPTDDLINKLYHSYITLESKSSR